MPNGKKNGESPVSINSLRVYTVADNIISPLGSGTSQNFAMLKNNESGVAMHDNEEVFPEPFHAALIDKKSLPFEVNTHYTYLENLLIYAIEKIFKGVSINKDRLILIISTTKGNIDLVDKRNATEIDEEAIFLPKMAERINGHFQLPNSPVLVSNACISGVSAVLTGKKLINSGRYDHALVAGVDIITEFVISGFNSFMALSDKSCKPYDENRNGINLGEACGAVLLSRDPGLCVDKNALSEVAGGGQSNDANHISGPSRTGEGLIIAIKKAFRDAGISVKDIDYINAHGTATLYNDEMEAQAFDYVKANDIPINSLKGYYGHTLGASGIIESILSIWQMNNNLLVRSAGFEKSGVTKPLNVIDKNIEKEIKTVLKTASGFGGCNGAVVFKKP